MSLERCASFADLALEYEQVAPIHSYSRAFYAYIRVSDASTASSWHDSIERCVKRLFSRLIYSYHEYPLQEIRLMFILPSVNQHLKTCARDELLYY